MDDVGSAACFRCGSVACFRCGDCAVGSIDDAVHRCFRQFDSSCLKCFRFGSGCGIGYDENDVFV